MTEKTTEKVWPACACFAKVGEMRTHREATIRALAFHFCGMWRDSLAANGICTAASVYAAGAMLSGLAGHAAVSALSLAEMDEFEKLPVKVKEERLMKMAMDALPLIADAARLRLVEAAAFQPDEAGEKLNAMPTEGRA